MSGTSESGAKAPRFLIGLHTTECEWGGVVLDAYDIVQPDGVPIARVWRDYRDLHPTYRVECLQDQGDPRNRFILYDLLLADALRFLNDRPDPLMDKDHEFTSDCFTDEETGEQEYRFAFDSDGICLSAEEARAAKAEAEAAVPHGRPVPEGDAP